MEEKIIGKKNGIIMLILAFALLIGCIAIFTLSIIFERFAFGIPLSILMFIVSIILFSGIQGIQPNEAAVYTLFGNYYGTIKEPGFYFVNPFSSAMDDPRKKTIKISVNKNSEDQSQTMVASRMNRISLKTVALNNQRQKVNDLLGNPVIIETIIVWRVKNPTKAIFQVENYSDYLSVQADSTVRNVARSYPYENLDYDDVADSEMTLTGSSNRIAQQMQEELQEKMLLAGIEVKEVRISHLAYAEEIAQAMLQRQQASAVISAKEKIVEGAVGMVEMALEKLAANENIVLDNDKKAQMVTNLMVVLSSSKDVTPTVNSGSKEV